VQEAYTNNPITTNTIPEQPYINIDCGVSDISKIPVDKSRKIQVLKADSENDSSSLRPSMLGY
jgi:hypothetical protein